VANPCKDILLESGFNSLDADHLLDAIRFSNKSLDELTADLEFKQNKKDFIPTQAERSYTLGASYLDAMGTVASTLKRPYKALMRYFASDAGGITQRAQSRWIGLLSRLTAESGVSSRDFFKMINGSITDKLGITDHFEPFRRALLRELSHDGENMIAGDVIANKLANAIKRNWRLDIGEANLYGAGIKFKKLWVTNQYHNPDLMSSHGGTNWINDIKSHIDIEQTIENIKHFYPKLARLSSDKFDLDKFLSNAYTSMTNATSEGTGILAEQFKMHRIFEFKSPDALTSYNKKYGHQNILHAVFQNMEMFQKYLTLGETMGFGRVITKPIKNPKPGGPTQMSEVFNPVLETRKMFQVLKDMGKLSPTEHSQLSAVLREITGDNMIVGSAKRSALVSNFIAWQQMAVLGKSMFSTVSDIGSASIMLHHQGIGPGQGYYGMIQHTMRQFTGGLSETEKRLVFQALHVATDGTLMSNASRYGVGMKTAGMLARGANEMFHLSGLNAMTNAMRNGYAYMSSNILANNLKKSWNQLSPNYRKDFLEKYDITQKDWEMLQQIGSFNAKLWKKDANKLENFVTMDHILERGNELKIDGIYKLAQKIDNYFIQESRSAIPEAKAQDRAILHGNHDRGNWLDVTRRLATVFRSYQSQLVRNLYPRIYKLGLPSVVHVVPFVALGYTSIALKNLVAGKEPPPADNPSLWVDALIHSGLAPIVGDFISGEYGRYDHGFDEDVGGISYSKFKGFKDLVVGLWDGDTDAADVWKSIRYNTPFANLFFTEAAVNYGLHYAMMESLRPKYLHGLEAQAASQGQDFFFEPSNLWG
jgi:hypothetical protein